MTIYRSVSVAIDPGAFPDELFKPFGSVCKEARRAYRPSLRDQYSIHVDIVSAGQFKTYDEASRIVVSNGKRRHLFLHELLALNRQFSDVKDRWPLFAGDFVLENELLEYDEVVQMAGSRWRLGLSAFHRGQILDRDSVFATTPVTKIGGWSPRSFDHLMAHPQSDETPRLTA